ncbi:hypothetical protein DL763_002767 [Monosporascus cannonballus]|nr:hypothetical protein DL763_002767 [Monosporascus cannonballus]
MPPVEFDKPPTAPIESDEYDKVLAEAVNRDGRRGIALRDKEGHLVYPNLVPPDVESPATTARASTTADKPSATAKPPELAESRPKTLSEPSAQPPAGLAEPPGSGRPYLEKKFLTDAPLRTEHPLHRVKRAATNLSIPDSTPEDQSYDNDDTSSSASSEEEEDGESKAGKVRKRDRARCKKWEEERFGRFRVQNENYQTKGKVSKKDGRLNITVNDTSNTGYLAKALGTAVKKAVVGEEGEGKPGHRPTPTRLSSTSTATLQKVKKPKLNIVIMVIGSRGDAQPFLKIGKVLKEDYGHRVRIATHPAFRDFVEKDSGLEFFSVGGDPSELMAFMVKNPGMIPKLESVKAGDIGKRRAAMAEMFEGFWRACTNATDSERDTRNLKMMGEKPPFVADAIIANPPSFAHIHCAEALGIPLHLMFTFPYTPTQAFPHPLATIKKSNVDPGYTNFISYPLVEMMVWQGLGDLVNDFRRKTLGLDPVSTLWAPGATYRLHVPVTYLWSPGLVPKPADWGDEIDVSGFVFLDLASSFKPPRDLVDFLDAGETPIYIGFGSIVVDDPDRFTGLIFEAVKLAGVRALVSKGWSGLDQDDVPDNIYMLENTPHDWLFPRVRACAIHGGAGTTAIALKCGKPTMVVPFFGDQYFWGSVIGSAGAGPMPVPYKRLTTEALAEGIKFCLTDKAKAEAGKIAESIELEGDGAKNAVRSFHSHLCLEGENSMRCAILTDRVAVWKVKSTGIKLSALAADILVGRGFLAWRGLRPIRHKEWNDFVGPGEPLTGIAGSLAGTVGDVFGGIGSVPYRLAKLSHKRAERRRKREAKRRHRLSKPSNNTSTTAPSYPLPTQSEGQAETNSNAQPGTPLADRPSGTRTPATATTPGTAGLTDDGQEEYFNEISEGVGKSGRALAHAPIDLALALAQGFHNAPRLYGDDTVRTPTRVTGIKSGLRAARSEFIYGIYDRWTGLVRLPVRGARERGFKGALAGVGMGITGFVLKDLAAILGPFSYALKGIAKQAERRGSRLEKTRRLIRRARIVQVKREIAALDDAERERVMRDVLAGWKIMRALADLVAAGNTKHGLLGLFHHQRAVVGSSGTGTGTAGGGAAAAGALAKSMVLSRWGSGRVFESVETAQRAIDALNRGEEPETVFGDAIGGDRRVPTDTEKNVDPGVGVGVGVGEENAVAAKDGRGDLANEHTYTEGTNKEGSGGVKVGQVAKTDHAPDGVAA